MTVTSIVQAAGQIDLAAIENVDEAVASVAHASTVLESVERRRIMVKLARGAIVEHMGREWGEGAVEELSDALWEKHRIKAGRSTLYEERKVYVEAVNEFDHGPYTLEEYVGNIEEHQGRPCYWKDLRNDLLYDTPEAEIVGGEEEADDKLAWRVERFLEDYRRIKAKAEEGDRQMQGVLAAAEEGMEEIIRDHRARELSPAEKDTIPRWEEYMMFIGMMPCAITGGYPSDVCHVLGKSGTGQKGSDLGTIPLKHELHMDAHTGEETFQRKHGVSFAELVANYQHYFLSGLRYGRGQWLSLQLPEPEFNVLEDLV